MFDKDLNLKHTAWKWGKEAFNLSSHETLFLFVESLDDSPKATDSALPTTMVSLMASNLARLSSLILLPQGALLSQ
jgi:hypothetical protein